MIALATLSVLLLAGCGGGSNEGTVGGVASAQRGEQSNAAPADKSVAATPGGKSLVGPQADSPDASASAAAKLAAPAVGIAARLTKSASLDLRVRDISAAAAQVRGVATALEAPVLSDQVGKGDPGEPPSRKGGNEPVRGFVARDLTMRWRAAEPSPDRPPSTGQSC